MEISYRIERAQLDAFKQSLLVDALARNEQRAQRLHQRMMRFIRGFLGGPGPLIIALVVAYWFQKIPLVSFVIAALISTALYWLWLRRFAQRVIDAIVRRAERREAAAWPRRKARLERIHAWRLDRTLKQLEGDHRLQLDEDALIQHPPHGPAVRQRWSELQVLPARAGFLRLGASKGRGRVYLIPQTATTMAAPEYSEALRQLLEKIPARVNSS